MEISCFLFFLLKKMLNLFYQGRWMWDNYCTCRIYNFLEGVNICWIDFRRFLKISSKIFGLFLLDNLHFSIFQSSLYWMTCLHFSIIIICWRNCEEGDRKDSIKIDEKDIKWELNLLKIIGQCFTSLIVVESFIKCHVLLDAIFSSHYPFSIDNSVVLSSTNG